MSDRKENIKLITRTALLLAVTLLFQELRRVLPGVGTLAGTLIIGSLVNLGLFVAAGIVGWRGSVLIALLTPVVAFLQNHLALAVLIPFVAAGNIVLVLVFEWIIRRIGMDKGRGWISVGGASVLKSLFLWGAIAQFLVRFLLPAQGLPAEKTAAMTAALSLNFSWPQLVTALIGGAVALVVLPAVRRALHAEEQLPR
jgi:hypothetical protein